MSSKEKAPAPTTPDGEAASTGSQSKMPMIAMIAVGLAIGGGSGAMVIGPMFAKKASRTPIEAHAAAEGDASQAPAEGGDHGGGAAPKEGAATAAHLLENLVLNPAGSGGTRFLLLSVALEAGSSTITANMTARDAELRDIILTSLGTKTVDQLTDISAREGIKTEVIAAIAARFGKGSVKRLYFPQFVVQ